MATQKQLLEMGCNIGNIIEKLNGLELQIQKQSEIIKVAMERQVKADKFSKSEKAKTNTILESVEDVKAMEIMHRVTHGETPSVIKEVAKESQVKADNVPKSEEAKSNTVLESDEHVKAMEIMHRLTHGETVDKEEKAFAKGSSQHSGSFGIHRRAKNQDVTISKKPTNPAMQYVPPGARGEHSLKPNSSLSWRIDKGEIPEKQVRDKGSKLSFVRDGNLPPPQRTFISNRKPLTEDAPEYFIGKKKNKRTKVEQTTRKSSSETEDVDVAEADRNKSVSKQQSVSSPANKSDHGW